MLCVPFPATAENATAKTVAPGLSSVALVPSTVAHLATSSRGFVRRAGALPVDTQDRRSRPAAASRCGLSSVASVPAPVRCWGAHPPRSGTGRRPRRRRRAVASGAFRRALPPSFADRVSEHLHVLLPAARCALRRRRGPRRPARSVPCRRSSIRLRPRAAKGRPAVSASVRERRRPRVDTPGDLSRPASGSDRLCLRPRRPIARASPLPSRSMTTAAHLPAPTHQVSRDRSSALPWPPRPSRTSTKLRGCRHLPAATADPPTTAPARARPGRLPRPPGLRRRFAAPRGLVVEQRDLPLVNLDAVGVDLHRPAVVRHRRGVPNVDHAPPVFVLHKRPALDHRRSPHPDSYAADRRSDRRVPRFRAR